MKPSQIYAAVKGMLLHATGITITFNDTTKRISIASTASGSFTKLAYRAPANAGNIVAEHNALLADMITKNIMEGPATYAVSGQITGAVQNNVALQLVGAQTYNATSDGAGNFSFSNVLEGSYTLTPTIAGHYFTPANRSVNVAVANVTAQNFTSAVATPSARTSPTHVFVPQNIGGTPKLRAINKSTRAIEAQTFPAITSLVYTPTYHNQRLFAPNGTQISVYDDAYNLRLTITPGVGTVYAVHAVGNKLCLVGSTGIRFGTYTNGSPDVWASGNLLANEVAPNASALFNGEVWITSTFSGTPTRNLTRYNVASEAITRSSYGGGNLRGIAAGTTTIAVEITSPQEIRVVNPTTLANIGSFISTGGHNPRNIVFSQGKYFAGLAASIGILTETGATGSISIPGIAGNGAVADETMVYIPNGGSADRLHYIDAATSTQSGSPTTGLSSPAFFTS